MSQSICSASRSGSLATARNATGLPGRGRRGVALDGDRRRGVRAADGHDSRHPAAALGAVDVAVEAHMARIVQRALVRPAGVRRARLAVEHERMRGVRDPAHGVARARPASPAASSVFAGVVAMSCVVAARSTAAEIATDHDRVYVRLIARVQRVRAVSRCSAMNASRASTGSSLARVAQQPGEVRRGGDPGELLVADLEEPVHARVLEQVTALADPHPAARPPRAPRATTCRSRSPRPARPPR